MSGFSASPVMASLKDFQRRTVDYVFRRMYLDKPSAKRFLVADEVGLGKTMVARGVIARALEHLEAQQRTRINIVYVCSNAAIARQNISRLNVLGKRDFSLASRLTLLPTEVHNLRGQPVNFISFTPGTTFDLKSRGGIKEERALLFRMLQGTDGVVEYGLLKALQATVGDDSWDHYAYGASLKFDAEMATDFCAAIRSDREFLSRLVAMTKCFSKGHSVSSEENQERYALIGELRQRLSRVCLNALEPDLIILDEFQRFRNLLDPNDPTAELAQALFQYQDARVLMLSATPYKMLSLDHEAEDDHYPDFLKTLAFLFDQDGAVGGIQRNIQSFRHALLDADLAQSESIQSARVELEQKLLSVMCRTERVGFTDRLDSMVIEPTRPATLRTADLKQAALLDRISRELGAQDSIEYWKSAPYPLNFMKGYELRHKLDQLVGRNPGAASSIVKQFPDQMLAYAPFQSYSPIDPSNARLRVLFADTLDQGMWRILWLPPSLPYWQPAGPFAQVSDVSKSLIFSAWNVVPDAIAALTSYEAERRMLAGLERDSVTHDKLYERLKPLLRFSKDAEGRLTGMPTLLLMHPSPSLAAMVDPVDLILQQEKGPVPTLLTVRRLVEAQIAQRLQPLLEGATTLGREDERWYWVACALLDARDFPEAINRISAAVPWDGDDFLGDPDHGEVTHDSAPVSIRDIIQAHLAQFVQAARGQLLPALGRPPTDLAQVLADIALAGPGVCALRSLRRIAPTLPWCDFYLMRAAGKVAVGLRSLFNLPESIALLRGGSETDQSYWRSTLRHGLEGNLAALLDEQAHVLRESLGLVDENATRCVDGIAEELLHSLSIRTSQLSLDELSVNPGDGKLKSESFKLRCRFALRFGQMKDEKSEARVETVRSAFNSPFRPFVLASTSVGQEGLDFHTWCHIIVHWNLPSNPVDLEQREGRIHRFKSHAVRKNVARELGLRALSENWTTGSDPWGLLFDLARQRRGCDLLTYWLFETEGGAKIERRIPMLPLSREANQLTRLKRGLALYRLVFGQPRQEDLLTHLADRLSSTEIERVVSEWRINLMPPME